MLVEEIHSTKLSVPITQAEVFQAINQLKNHKAQDANGITAEHLKFGSDTLTPILTKLFNVIIESGKIPTPFKGGIITPVHKKGKPQQDMGNY